MKLHSTYSKSNHYISLYLDNTGKLYYASNILNQQGFRCSIQPAPNWIKSPKLYGDLLKKRFYETTDRHVDPSGNIK